MLFYKRKSMSIAKSQILQIVKDYIKPEDLQRSMVFWDQKIRKRGEQLQIGPKTYTMPFDGTILFVDLEPRLNWAHPTEYLLVNNHGQNVEAIESSYPLYQGEYPDTYILLLKYGVKPADDRDFSPFTNSK